MTEINKLRIGLALNAIGLMLEDEPYQKIKDRLTEIEQIVKDEPTTEDPEGKPTQNCIENSLGVLEGGEA